MAGVKLRASRGRGETAEEEGVGGRENEWSKVYPLGSSTHKWNKPQLLAEVCVFVIIIHFKSKV